MEIDCSTLRPDLASVNALARLRLRCRCARFKGMSRELGELVVFCGLGETLGVQARRQPEEREERLCLEEEGELADAGS
jgi:hypothetical protein